MEKTSQWITLWVRTTKEDLVCVILHCDEIRALSKENETVRRRGELTQTGDEQDGYRIFSLYFSFKVSIGKWEWEIVGIF